jgi:hypothetical protein
MPSPLLARVPAIKGWSIPFEDPVPGMTTLRDAANCIQKLPKAKQAEPHWQAAVAALILAAEGKGPLLHARVGMLRAMNHGVERVFRTDRKATHWGKRELKRKPPLLMIVSSTKVAESSMTSACLRRSMASRVPQRCATRRSTTLVSNTMY